MYNRFLIMSNSEENADESWVLTYVHFYKYVFLNDRTLCVQTLLTQEELMKLLKGKSVAIQLVDVIIEKISFEETEETEKYLNFIEDTNPLEVNQETVDKILDNSKFGDPDQPLSPEEEYVLYAFSKQT